MSQIPQISTALETPAPIDQIGRRNAIAVPQIGIQESLNAPGAVGTVFSSEGARLAAGALEALGLVGQVATTVRAYSERAQAIQEGQGNNNAEADIPSITQKIAAGDIARLDGMTSAEQAELVIGAYTKDLPESAASGYRKRAVPAVAAAFSQKDAQIVKESRDALLAGLGGTAAAARTPEELDAAFEHARAIPGVTDMQAAEATHLVALRRAAIKGDLDTFSMIASHTPENLFAIEKAQLEEVLDTAMQRRMNQIDIAARESVAASINAGRPLDAIRAEVLADGRYDERTRLMLLGDLNRRDDEQLRTAQGLSANNIRRDVMMGRALPGFGSPGEDPAIVNTREVLRRMDLPSTDPEWLPASEGGSILSLVQRTVDRDVRFERVANFFSATLSGGKAVGPSSPSSPASAPGVSSPGGGSPVPPMTSKDDPSALKYYAMAGVVDGVEDATGSMVLNRINEPIRFASYVTTANRVPADAVSLIEAGMGSNDQGQFVDASAAYSAIYRQSPSLAASMTMDATAALRARFVASRIERTGPTTMMDATLLRNEIARIAPEAMRIKPASAELAETAVFSRVFWNEAESPSASKDIEVNSKARASLMAGMNESEVVKRFGTLEKNAPGFMGGISISDAPAEVVAEYRKLVAEEYRFARAFMPSEEKAAAAAKKWATERTLSAHPPLVWGGTLYWTNRRDAAATPGLQALIENDLKTPQAGEIVGDGFDAARSALISDLTQNYVPVWDERQAGFVFYSVADPYMKKTVWTDKSVGPLVIDPFTPNPAAGSTADQVKRAIDDNRKAKAAAAQAKSAQREAVLTREQQAREDRRLSGRPRGGGLD